MQTRGRSMKKLTTKRTRSEQRSEKSLADRIDQTKKHFSFLKSMKTKLASCGGRRKGNDSRVSALLNELAERVRGPIRNTIVTLKEMEGAEALIDLADNRKTLAGRRDWLEHASRADENMPKDVRDDFFMEIAELERKINEIDARNAGGGEKNHDLRPLIAELDEEIERGKDAMRYWKLKLNAELFDAHRVDPSPKKKTRSMVPSSLNP